MDLPRMRLLDRWVGVPACAGLTLIRRIARLRRLAPNAKPRRILFIKLAEQGATVVADSALRSAAHRTGRNNVFAIVFEQNRFILDLLDVVPRDNVITIRTTGLVQLVTDFVRASRRVRREHIDTAIDLEFFS